MAQQNEVPHEVRLRIPQRVEGRSTMASSTQRTLLSTSPLRSGHGSPGKTRQTLQTMAGKRCGLSSRLLCPQGRTGRNALLHPRLSSQTSSSFRGDWNCRISPMMNLPCWGKSLPSAMHDDGETGVETYDDTTRPKNEIRLSLSLGTKLRKWGKPLTK